MALSRQWRGPPSDARRSDPQEMPLLEECGQWQPPEDPQEPVQFSHEPMLLVSLKDLLVCRPWLPMSLKDLRRQTLKRLQLQRHHQG
jgi:hypothetical protein